MRDVIESLFTTILGWIIVLALLIGGTSVLLHWQPWVENEQTEITRGTHQYVESKRQEMATKIEAYDDLAIKISQLKNEPTNAETMEQMKILQRRHYKDIKETASLLEPAQVPADVKKFLEVNE